MFCITRPISSRPFEQPLLVVRVDIEMVNRAVGSGHGLRLEVDGDMSAGFVVQLFKQFLLRCIRQYHLERRCQVHHNQAARRRLFGALANARGLPRIARPRTYGAGAGSRMRSSAGM